MFCQCSDCDDNRDKMLSLSEGNESKFLGTIKRKGLLTVRCFGTSKGVQPQKGAFAVQAP